jgi:hypothetical protein
MCKQEKKVGRGVPPPPPREKTPVLQNLENVVVERSRFNCKETLFDMLATMRRFAPVGSGVAGLRGMIRSVPSRSVVVAARGSGAGKAGVTRMMLSSGAPAKVIC